MEQQQQSDKELLASLLEYERALGHTNLPVKRGASEGPLQTLIPVFIDFETWMSDDVKLGAMTLRQYLAATHVTAMSLAVAYDDPSAFLVPDGEFAPEDKEIILILRKLAVDPAYVFVAHNAAFDIRVQLFLLGVPFPKNVWCTMEGAMGAWPELPGGYGLANLGKRLNFPDSLRKIEIDLMACSDAELLEYNKRDVRSMQELYAREIALLPAEEQRVALRTNQQRRFHFEVAQSKLVNLMTVLNQQAEYAEKEAASYVVDQADLGEIFNRDGDDKQLRSIRSQRLLKIINEKMGGDFASTSMKKISPLKLAQHPQIAQLLTAAGNANKMISHFRRSKVFINVDEVDVELGYMRAHTGRFSSPSVGKGLNLHNIPKHNKLIAQPIRSVFHLPKDLCFVRADLSNVEYRVEGKLTGCRTVTRMFDESMGGNVFTDPYCEAWKAMTAQKINKKDPIRQVAKAAVLGLGFCMGPAGYARGSLLTALADKKSGVTEDVLRNIALELGWRDPSGDGVKRVITQLGCSHTVALCAYHIHRVFNEAHPEFSKMADWLVSVVNAVASTFTRAEGWDMIRRAYESQRAPDPAMIKLEIDDDPTFERNSVRVCCGPWPRTVCWRNPKVRPTTFENGPADRVLTILKSTGKFKRFTRQLAIENVTQAAARNGLCWAIEQLEYAGFPDVLHVHDELLIITKRCRENVLAARQAMIDIVGPKGRHPLGWAVMVKPDEISVTESMWESEEDISPPKLNKDGVMVGGDRWGKIERNEPGCLENLP